MDPSSSSFSSSSSSHPPALWDHPKEWSRSTNHPLTHPLPLSSAYAHRPTHWTTGEPAFTTFHGQFKGTVDYIWFGASTHPPTHPPTEPPI